MGLDRLFQILKPNQSEKILNGVFFLAQSVALAVSMYMLPPKAIQLVREYSAGVALICTVSGDVNCARGANFIADIMGANKTDEFNGLIRIINKLENNNGK